MAGELEDLENTLGYDPPLKRRCGRPRKSACKHGHSFAGDNIIRLKNGKRACRACRNATNRKWRAKNPAYNAKYYIEKTGEAKLRFRWDGEEGKVVGVDLARLLKTDWVIAADFLKDVMSLVEGYYDEVLEVKYTDEGESYGG
jgi:hypothetical protein